MYLKTRSRLEALVFAILLGSTIALILAAISILLGVATG